jgi:hypothetical protein
LVLPRISFTPHLEKFVTCPQVSAEGTTVREVLDTVFAENPLLRGYVVDEQGSLRKHMAVFVDGHPVQDRVTLSDTVHDSAEVYVLQALSGG